MKETLLVLLLLCGLLLRLSARPHPLHLRVGFSCVSWYNERRVFTPCVIARRRGTLSGSPSEGRGAQAQTASELWLQVYATSSDRYI